MVKDRTSAYGRRKIDSDAYLVMKMMQADTNPNAGIRGHKKVPILPCVTWWYVTDMKREAATITRQKRTMQCSTGTGMHGTETYHTMAMLNTTSSVPLEIWKFG